MRELDVLQKYLLETAWYELKKTEALMREKRIARAQENIQEALRVYYSLPRWFTDEDWMAQYDKLHRKLYTGV